MLFKKSSWFHGQLYDKNGKKCEYFSRMKKKTNKNRVLSCLLFDVLFMCVQINVKTNHKLSFYSLTITLLFFCYLHTYNFV